MISAARILLLLWSAMLVLACSDSGESTEDQIEKYLAAGVEAAEGRSLDELGEMIHQDYLDQKGYRKQQLVGLLRAYFFRHRNIHLFSRIDEIEVLDDTNAVVRLHVAMAGSAISDVNAIAALRARVYRFELRLIKDDEWFLRHASWSPASIADLE